MTTITLPPAIEAWAQAEVAAGRADSVEAAVLEALADAAYPDPHPGKTTKEMIEEARASFDRGEYISGEDFLKSLDERIARLEAEG